MPGRVARGARGMEEAGPINVMRTVIHNGDGATPSRRARIAQTTPDRGTRTLDPPTSLHLRSRTGHQSTYHPSHTLRPRRPDRPPHERVLSLDNKVRRC